MGQQASAPPPQLPFPRASAWLRKEPLTGHLLRHVPRWRRSRRWAWHVAVFDSGHFQTTTWPGGLKADAVPLASIIRAEAVALAAPRALFTPLDARAIAPREEATPAGFLLHIKGGNELLLCARSAAERQRWLDALAVALADQEELRKREDSLGEEPLAVGAEVPGNPSAEGGAVLANGAAAASADATVGPPTDAVTTPATPSGDAAETAEPLLVTQGSAFAGEAAGGGGQGLGRGAGKGKGKGKPAPGPPPKAGPSLPKAGLTPKAGSAAPKKPPIPKIHGLIQKDQRVPKETANTIFHCTGSTPRPNYDLSAFVTSSEALQPKARPTTRVQEARKRVLDDKLAQAVGVAVARLDLPTVIAAVEALDPSFGGLKDKLIDGAENLHEVLAGRKDRDPLGQIHEYLQRGGEPEVLRSIEQSLLPLARVPRAAQRLQLLLLRATLPDRLDKAKKQLGILVETARDAEKSRLLREVVRIIQVAMAWNASAVGVAAPGAARHVFNVGEQLERLKTIKPPGSVGGRTFVTWMAEELMLRCGWYLGQDPFASEVPMLQESAKANPALVYEELLRVQQGSRLAASEFEEHFCAYSLQQSLTHPALASSAPSIGAAAQQPSSAVGQASSAPMATRPPASAAASEEPATAAEAADLGGARLEKRRRGPQEFRLSDGFDLLLLRPEDRARCEAFDLDAPCGRPTELASHAAHLQPVPAPVASWDPRRVPRGARARRLTFYRPGAFARAGRCAPSSVESILERPAGPTVDDGEASAQGFLYLLLPHKARRHSWERCWADVRAHHLVVRRMNGTSLGREAALPLPGAEVLPLECLYASELARWLASQHAYGFEIRNLPGDAGGASGRPLVARIEGAAAAERWERALRAEAERRGVGALWLRSGCHGSRWESRWCILDSEAQQLSCFAKRLDHVMGLEPQMVLDLSSTTLRSLAVPPDGGPRVCSGGGAFELEEALTGGLPAARRGPGRTGAREPAGRGCLTTFCVESPEDLKRWLGALQTFCGAASLRKSYCAPLDCDTTALERPWDEAASSDGDSPFAQLAKERPSFARALREAPPVRGPTFVDLLATTGEEEATEEEAVAVAAGTDSGAGAVAAEAVGGEDAGAGGGASAGALQDLSSVPRLALGSGSGSGAAASNPPTWSPGGDASDSEGSFATTESDSEQEVFKTAASSALSDDSEGSDGDGEEAGTVARLRQLGQELRREATALEERLRAGECAAQTALRFFGEEPPPGGALAALQGLLGQVAGFARDLGAAAGEVRRREEGKAKAQAKSLSPTKRRSGLGGASSGASPASPAPRAASPKPACAGGAGGYGGRCGAVCQDVVVQPTMPARAGGS